MNRPVVVVGGGVAGLVAARRLALGGRRVVLLERGPAFGGRVAGTSLEGTAAPVDAGAESFAVRGGAVARLAERLGLGDRLVSPRPGGAWVLLPDRAVPLPAGGLLGVPANPLAPDVVRVLDRVGAARAHLDRLLPPLRIGRYGRLGELVAGRMGHRVLDRLVAPVVESVYGADPATVPVDAVAPGLNAAIGATGSLAGAVARLRGLAPAGSAVQSLEGGVHVLVAALVADLVRLGVDVRADAPALALVAADDGPVVETPGGAIAAVGVVLALDGGPALDLLAPVAPVLTVLPRPVPRTTRAVLLAVDDARLDARPRGSGVLVAAGTPGVRASALTHVTAKWGGSPGRHVLRLAYRDGGPVDDAQVLSDARAMLGVPVAAPPARADAVWTDSAPALAAETRAARAALAAPGALPQGVALAGSWVHGTGLAAVVAGAERTAAALLAGAAAEPGDLHRAG